MPIAKRSWIAVALACGMSSACVSVESSTTYSHTLLTRRTSVTTNPDSTSYTTAIRVERDDLLVTPRSEQSCTTSVVPVYRKEAHTTRRPTAGPRGTTLAPRNTLVAGLILGGLGVYGYVEADRLAMNEASGEGTPAEYRNSGLASAAVGTGLLVIALVDSIRLRDTTAVVGPVDGRAEVRTDPCHARRFDNTPMVASAPGLSWRVESASDGGGEVRLELHDLPEDAFASPELQLALHVDSSVIPLKLTAEATQQLHTTLIADDTSQVARDREARAIARCAERVAAADAVSFDAGTPAHELEQAEASWRAARSECGQRWQPAHEQAFAAFRAQLDAVVAQRARDHCVAAGEAAAQLMNDELASGEHVNLDAVRELLAEHCRDATNASSILSRFATRANQLRRARAQAAKAEAAAERREVYEPSRSAPTRSCCKFCRRGCACGNTCISCSKTCRAGPGCAC